MTPPGRLMKGDSGPSLTDGPKLRPASVEQRATTWLVTSPDASRPVSRSQATHTRPFGPAASAGPELGAAVPASPSRIMRGAAKVSPASVERLKARPDLLPAARAALLLPEDQTT